jgi:hypothetical protein
VPEWHTAALPATFLSSPDAKNEPPLSIRLAARMKILRYVSLHFAPAAHSPQLRRTRFASRAIITKSLYCRDFSTLRTCTDAAAGLVSRFPRSALGSNLDLR